MSEGASGEVVARSAQREVRVLPREIEKKKMESGDFCLGGAARQRGQKCSARFIGGFPVDSKVAKTVESYPFNHAGTQERSATGRAESGEQLVISAKKVVGEADQAGVGDGAAAEALEFGDAVGFGTGAAPDGEADEGGGGGAADTGAAVDEERSLDVLDGMGEADDGGGVGGSGGNLGQADLFQPAFARVGALKADRVIGIGEINVVEREVQTVGEVELDRMFTSAMDGDDRGDALERCVAQEHGGFRVAEDGEVGVRHSQGRLSRDLWDFGEFSPMMVSLAADTRRS